MSHHALLSALPQSHFDRFNFFLEPEHFEQKESPYLFSSNVNNEQTKRRAPTMKITWLSNDYSSRGEIKV